MCLPPEFVGLLLEAGGDLNIRNRDGVTPLHEASWNGELDKVRFLVDQGADPAARDANHDSTPLGWAVYGRQKEIAQYLKTNTPVDVIDGVTLGMTDHVLTLLDEDPTQVHAFGGAPMRTAAHFGNETLVRRMLELGADPALPNPESGKNALDLARDCGHDNVVTLLEGTDG